MSDHNFESGSPCPRLECAGELWRREKGECTCHINPPCLWCTDVTLECSECDWCGGWRDYDRDFEGGMALAAGTGRPPRLIWVAPPVAPMVLPLPKEPQVKRHDTRYDGKHLQAGFLAEWGEWLWSSWWSIDDGSAEAEVWDRYRAAKVRRQVAEYPTAGVMVSASVRK